MSHEARVAFDCMSAAIAICRAISRECGGQILVTGKLPGSRELVDATSDALGPLAKEFDTTKCVLGKPFPHADVATTITLVDWILNKGREDKQVVFALQLYEKKHGPLPPFSDKEDPSIISGILEVWLDHLARSPVMSWLEERSKRAP